MENIETIIIAAGRIGGEPWLAIKRPTAVDQGQPNILFMRFRTSRAYDPSNLGNIIALKKLRVHTFYIYLSSILFIYTST